MLEIQGLQLGNHFLDREVFDLLVPLFFFLCQECSVNIIYGLVYSLQCLGRLDSSYQYRVVYRPLFNFIDIGLPIS